MEGHDLLLRIAGGVALLLWAARMVRTGIMRAYGAEIRRHLGNATKDRFRAFAMGLGVSGLLQSSAAVALLCASFAGRGLILTGPGIALMLGADVGSTLVVQVLSFDLSWLSPALILIGFILYKSASAPLRRHLGRIALGLGLLLLSLQLIVGASEPLRQSETLGYVIAPLANDPILAVLLAAVLTWIAHSSVATVLLIMSLTSIGVVPLELGFALVLGANIGSAVVSVALTYSGSAAERRIPLGVLLFRVLGAALALPLVGSVAPEIAALGSDGARQIANFHTLFNLAVFAVGIWFVSPMARLIERVLPDTETVSGPIKPRYLDFDAIENPAVALASATREVLRMADIVETMLRGVADVFRADDLGLLTKLSRLDDDVDALYEAIKLYLTRVSRNTLNEEDSQRCVELITFTTNLEHMGDIVDKNLLEAAQEEIEKRLAFSEQGWGELKEMHGLVVDHMTLAMSVFVSGDLATARRLLAEKDRFRELEREGNARHLQRLREGQIESIETSAIHLDILRDLKRINSHLSSVAYPILDAEGELRSSRLRVQPSEDRGRTEADDIDSALDPG